MKWLAEGMEKLPNNLVYLELYLYNNNLGENS